MTRHTNRWIYPLTTLIKTPPPKKNSCGTVQTVHSTPVRCGIMVWNCYRILNGVISFRNRCIAFKGVLDVWLLLDRLVEAMSKATLSSLLVCQLQQYSNQSNMAADILVTFWLDYRNTVYVGLPFKTVCNLQFVQNAVGHVLLVLSGLALSDHCCSNWDGYWFISGPKSRCLC